jgi:hypothetical protein
MKNSYYINHIIKMSNQIYLLHEKSRHNFKIGSTCNFSNRIGGYITPCDYFYNSTHFIILYGINSTHYTYCQSDLFFHKKILCDIIYIWK